MASSMKAQGIAKDEQRKYEKIWNESTYRLRSPGERFFLRAYDDMKPQFRDTLCDWGIGTGRAATLFQKRGVQVDGLDIARNAVRGEFEGKVWIGPMWDPPFPKDKKFTFGYCTDVMEHIPPKMVINCLKAMKRHTADECWFSIANFPDREGDKVGETLHLTVRSADWWAASFARVFPRFQFFSESKHFIVRAFSEKLYA